MQSITIDQYLEDRVEDQLSYYNKAASKAKKRFQRLKVVEVVLASFVPFLSALINEDNAGTLKVIVGLVGVGITLLSGVLLVYKFQEDWVNYRSTAEALTAEKFKFLARTGPYQGSDASSIFIEKVERILGDESQKWQTYAMEKKEDEVIREQMDRVNTITTYTYVPRNDSSSEPEDDTNEGPSQHESEEDEDDVPEMSESDRKVYNSLLARLAEMEGEERKKKG
ncbi:MAG: hypothetical protein RLZZ165_810 [Bacteroidota bacterium]|jgi:hypothetical protein